MNMNDRINFGSGAPREPIVGNSRAVRVGNQVWVAETTATGPGRQLVGRGALSPATAMIEVARPIDPAMLVEFEADVVIAPEVP